MGISVRRPRNPLLTVVTVVLVFASVVLSTTAFAVRGSADRAAPQRQCTTIDDLTEETMQHEYVGKSLTVPVQNVGESLVYYDNLYNPQNQVVGHAVGFVSAIYRRPSDGHLMTQYYETVQLPQGMFSDSGVVDRYALFSGATAHFTAVGTSGAYLGWTGTRSWYFPPPVLNPPKPDTRLKVTIVLCH